MMKQYEATVRVKFLIKRKGVSPSLIGFKKVVSDSKDFEVLCWQTDDEVMEVEDEEQLVEIKRGKRK